MIHDSIQRRSHVVNSGPWRCQFLLVLFILIAAPTLAVRESPVPETAEEEPLQKPAAAEDRLEPDTDFVLQDPFSFALLNTSISTELVWPKGSMPRLGRGVCSTSANKLFFAIVFWNFQELNRCSCTPC